MDPVDPVVSVAELRKHYGAVAAVDGVSCEVDRGEVFGIVGPNGAGKTTTVECLEGLRRPDGGSLRVLGLDPARHPRALHRRIGVQLQRAVLPNRLKVWEALDLYSALYGRRATWRPLLEEWGLAERDRTAFADLSGGERQRLLTAVALVGEPEIVFLDELATGLDPAARRAAWELVRTVRANGTTVLLVTHLMEEAEQLCDRVAVLDRGHLVALDTPAALARAQGVARLEDAVLGLTTRS